MNLRTELEALRQHLDKLAADFDEALTDRYALRQPPLPPGLYWRLRWLARQVLNLLQWMRIVPPPPWPSVLKHAPGSARARPLLIWAVGVDRETLRQACRGFSTITDGFAPVLVTDVADFAFFSRLGWLVEYLPPLSGEGEPYDGRKAKFLARLYRGAPALPVLAGIDMGTRAQEFRRWIVRGE